MMVAAKKGKSNLLLLALAEGAQWAKVVETCQKHSDGGVYILRATGVGSESADSPKQGGGGFLAALSKLFDMRMDQTLTALAIFNDKVDINLVLSDVEKITGSFDDPGNGVAIVLDSDRTI